MSGLNTLLGVRTDFSLGESALASEDVAAIAVRLGQTDVAVADTMRVDALIDVTRACQKVGVEAHVGVRLRIMETVIDDAGLMQLPRDKKAKNKAAYYIKVYPKNEAGMREIYRVVSRGFDEDRFYFLPRLTLDDVLDVITPDNCVVTTGDAEGVLTRPSAKVIYDRLYCVFGPDLFVELVPIPQPYFERLNTVATTLAHPAQQFIVAAPVLFDGEDGLLRFKLNMGIHNRHDYKRGFFNDPWWKTFTPKSAEEMTADLKATVQGMRFLDPSIDAKDFIAGLKTGNAAFLAATAYRWKKSPIALPKLAADPDKALLDLCRAGIPVRLGAPVFGYVPTPQDLAEKYVPRLKYELGVLRDLGFADYFLVVADLVSWAKSVNIMVGPGRGSVGGSLVAFLVGITDIDPIRFDLLFERFINPSRNDLPDADLDFMSTRREEIILYLERKYGKDHVGGINNYGVLKSASAIKDVARVHGMPLMEINCTKFIPAEHGQPVDLETAHKQVGEIQKFATSNPKVWAGAVAMQGVMRSYGRHAAGTIVSGVPLIDRAVVERDGDNRKVNWDMRVVEDQGLVKMDVLGLTTLDTLASAVRYIKQRHGGLTVDLMRIPLDDVPTLEAFSRGETIGIFQFEGGAARRILKDMAQSSTLEFNDLVAANALNRPGPIDAGLVQQYVDARNGNRTIGLPHPNMGPALAETFNVIVYQEQVMRIATDLCGFTLSEADKLRKAMGKKDKVLMASYRQMFTDGAFSHSAVPEAVAGELFDQIEVFAGYAFNKSHAAEYSLISYQAMWLKVHYPVEFYAASLSTVDEKKLSTITSDAKIKGITVMPPDINISTGEFEIANDTTLYIPFNRVKGISDKTTSAILLARKDGPFKDTADLTARVERRVCNVRHVASLDSIGAFARVEPGQESSAHESRRKEQMTLLPGLMTGVIVADRVIPKDKFTLAYLKEIIDDINASDPDAFHANPVMGRNAKMMIVTDAPNRSEEFARKLTEGDSFSYTAAALTMADLNRNDAYWTSLVKRRKQGKTLTPQEIKTYTPFLDREVELLKPPLIVTLGTSAARHFLPDLKGDMMDHAGKMFWDEKRDAMILVGFNPQQCYHDGNKIDLLAEIFELAKSVVLPDA
jgi:DNA polymerase-3 subunit alpha